MNMQKLISAIQGTLPKKKEWKDHLTNDKLIREYQGHNKCLTSSHSAIANGIREDVEERIYDIVMNKKYYVEGKGWLRVARLPETSALLAHAICEALPSIIIKEAKG